MNAGTTKPDAEHIQAALRGNGLNLPLADLRILDREDRVAAILPDSRIAWFPTNEAGRQRLERESRVLVLLARHCSFTVPRLIRETPDFQLRTLVEGRTEPWQVYRQVKSDPGYARALGNALGTVLADQHRVPIAELDWLPRIPSWPEPIATIARDLPRVIDDRALIARALAHIESHEAEVAASTARVLTHGDFGLHNFAYASDGSLTGVFDYDGAAFLDRHHDFAYLVFDTENHALFEAAVAAYTAARGQPIDPARVLRLNAAAAIGFLAWRASSGPEEKPAGRTLAEDLAWTRLALDRAG